MALNKELYETGDGASIVVENDDIQNDSGIFTDIYLALFSTVSEYWANNVFDININSETEKALTSNSLDPKGIENIKRAVESDLLNLGYADFIVLLTEIDNSRLEIKIDAQNNGIFQVVWDFTENQIIEFKTI